MMEPAAIRRTILRCGEATLLTGLALALSLLIGDRVPEGFVFLFLAAVVASAWRGGRVPGLYAALVGALTLDYFFLPPSHTLGISREALPYLIPFLLSALAAAWMSATRRIAGAAQAES